MTGNDASAGEESGNNPLWKNWFGKRNVRAEEAENSKAAATAEQPDLTHFCGANGAQLRDSNMEIQLPATQILQTLRQLGFRDAKLREE